MAIKLIPGNCQQIAILESIIATQENVVKVESGDSVPIFPRQFDYDSKVHYTQYWIGARNGSKFLPKVYNIRFEYNDIKNTAALKINRDVIEALQKEYPAIFRAIEGVEQSGS